MGSTAQVLVAVRQSDVEQGKDGGVERLDVFFHRQADHNIRQSPPQARELAAQRVRQRLSRARWGRAGDRGHWGGGGGGGGNPGPLTRHTSCPDGREKGDNGWTNHIKQVDQDL